VFFSGRVFESHPLSIFSASPNISCITSMPTGISLGVRAIGDWSKALNSFANEGLAEIRALTPEKHADDFLEVPVQVMIDGPYGGCSVDLGEYETAILIAGGAGITFTLGLLDDIVGRCVRQGRKNGERTRRIEFAWCVRSFGEFLFEYHLVSFSRSLSGSIDWFAPALMDIAHAAASSSTSVAPLDLHISIYVTCLCNPEAVPSIPNCDVTIIRPSLYKVILDLTNHSEIPSKADLLKSGSSSPDISEPEKLYDTRCRDAGFGGYWEYQ
jgi:ferric-chelate reductase